MATAPGHHPENENWAIFLGIGQIFSNQIVNLADFSDKILNLAEF